jgi:hypothetical protein
MPIHHLLRKSREDMLAHFKDPNEATSRKLEEPDLLKNIL